MSDKRFSDMTDDEIRAMAASAPAADGSYVPVICAVCGREIHDGEHIDLYGEGFAHASHVSGAGPMEDVCSACRVPIAQHSPVGCRVPEL